MWLCAALGSLIWIPAAGDRAARSIRGDLGWAAIGLMVGSGLLHALYFSLLQRGYATGDLSVVYPLARGTGPLLSGAAAIAFLGERPSALALAGGLIIVAAVFSLVGRRRLARGGRLRRPHRRRDRELHAVGQARGRPVRAVAGRLLLGHQPDRRARPRALGLPARAAGAAAISSRAAGVGLLSPLAYVLVLFALARAPVSAVAPARETSILIGTLLGTTVLGEGDAAPADDLRRRGPARRHRAGAGLGRGDAGPPRRRPARRSARRSA